MQACGFLVDPPAPATAPVQSGWHVPTVGFLFQTPCTTVYGIGCQFPYLSGVSAKVRGVALVFLDVEKKLNWQMESFCGVEVEGFKEA